jgi:hypothetical protein
MKKMKFLLILVLTFYFSALPIFAQKTLQLKVFAQKDTYLEGEIIDIGLSLTNYDSISVSDDKYGIDIQIIDSTGKVLPYVGPSDTKFLPGRDYIKPNNETYHVIELNSNFGEKLLRFGLFELYFKEGNYKLDIIYYKPNAKPEHNIIYLHIIHPEGDELIVFNNLIKIVSMPGTPQYSDTSFVNELMKLHRGHLNSVYSPIILNILVAWYSDDLKDPITANILISELVEKYTWSSRGRGYLDTILKNMTSPNTRVGFLKKILPNSRNSAMQKYIEQKIQNETLN